MTTVLHLCSGIFTVIIGIMTTDRLIITIIIDIITIIDLIMVVNIIMVVEEVIGDAKLQAVYHFWYTAFLFHTQQQE
jgi:hypothetical protein